MGCMYFILSLPKPLTPSLTPCRCFNVASAVTMLAATSECFTAAHSHNTMLGLAGISSRLEAAVIDALVEYIYLLISGSIGAITDSDGISRAQLSALGAIRHGAKKNHAHKLLLF